MGLGNKTSALFNGLRKHRNDGRSSRHHENPVVKSTVGREGGEARCTCIITAQATLAKRKSRARLHAAKGQKQWFRLRCPLTKSTPNLLAKSATTQPWRYRSLSSYWRTIRMTWKRRPLTNMKRTKMILMTLWQKI